MQKQRKRFKFSLVLKDTETRFKENWDPGVLVTQEIVFSGTLEEYKSDIFLDTLIDKKREFIDSCIKVKVEEIEDEIEE